MKKVSGESALRNKGTVFMESGRVLDGFEDVLFDGGEFFKKIRPQSINFGEGGLFKGPDWELAFAHGKRNKKKEIRKKNLFRGCLKIASDLIGQIFYI